MKHYLLIGTVLTALALSACNNNAPDTKSSEPAVPEITAPVSNVDAVVASMNHTDRPMDSRKDDAIRKAQDVLVFTGIKPGDAVFEMEAGGGYYTEIISRIVGSDGRVVLQNPASFDTFLSADVFEALLGPDGTRLSNVTHSKSNFDTLDAEDNSMDVVTWVLGPHETWYKGQDGTLDLGSPESTYAEIVRILKPGGHFIALDHAAASGAPETTGGTTHRIDPAIVKTYAEAAGLTFVKESDVLGNTDDDYDVMVFDPSVRRKTDRFLHMYKLP